jgi:hypothetical protein
MPSSECGLGMVTVAVAGVCSVGCSHCSCGYRQWLAICLLLCSQPIVRCLELVGLGACCYVSHPHGWSPYLPLGMLWTGSLQVGPYMTRRLEHSSRASRAGELPQQHDGTVQRDCIIITKWGSVRLDWRAACHVPSGEVFIFVMLRGLY